MTALSVAIAEDNPKTMELLNDMLENEDGIQVVGKARTGEEAYKMIVSSKPDVVLMDMRMPEFDGAWGIAAIKKAFPAVKVLVLTTFDDQETIDAAVGSGADGYILKEMEDEKVIQSVKMVCSGMGVFGVSVFEGIRRQMTLSKGGDDTVPEAESSVYGEEPFGLEERNQGICKLYI